MRADQPDEPAIHHPQTALGKRREVVIAVCLLSALWILLMWLQFPMEKAAFSTGRLASVMTVLAYSGPVWIAILTVMYWGLLNQNDKSQRK